MRMLDPDPYIMYTDPQPAKKIGINSSVVTVTTDELISFFNHRSKKTVIIKDDIQERYMKICRIYLISPVYLIR